MNQSVKCRMEVSKVCGASQAIAEPSKKSIACSIEGIAASGTIQQDQLSSGERCKGETVKG